MWKIFTHAWFRDYSSTPGRWMTPDPAGMAAADPANPQSWNRYAYVGNNPLNATDPTGLLTLPCFAGLDCGGEGGGDCDPMLGDGCDGWGGIDLGCGMLDPCDNPCPEPGICESPEGGSGPRSPRRGSGVAPTTETLGLPGGLNVHPLSLGDFFGLTPGCDFGRVCVPMENSLAGVDDAAEASICLLQPEVCVAVGLGVVTIYAAIKYGPAIIKATKEAANTAGSFLECLNQYARDLKACAEAYPPGLQRVECFKKAKAKLEFCKGDTSGPIQ